MKVIETNIGLVDVMDLKPGTIFKTDSSQYYIRTAQGVITKVGCGKVIAINIETGEWVGKYKDVFKWRVTPISSLTMA